MGRLEQSAALRTSVACAASMFCTLLATPVGAQESGPGSAVIQGRVVSSPSGDPLNRMSVCVEVAGARGRPSRRCDRTTLDGTYIVSGIPPGRHAIRASCSAIAAPPVRFHGDSITVVEGTQLRRDWAIDPHGCDLRRPRTLTGIFRGHYTTGFEESRFVPCPADEWFEPGDSLHLYPFDAGDAWVEFRDGVLASVPRWPEVPRGPFGYPRYFVRLQGEILGPGGYGHLGVSVFRFTVDSVLALRAPTPSDCG